MESDWIDYKCKSGQTMFIYNKVSGVHKWPPEYNIGPPEDSIMHGQPFKHKELQSIATQTDDYGCNNGCTSMYIHTTDTDHVSKFSGKFLQPEPDVSDCDDDLDINNLDDPENTLEDEQEHSQYMKEVINELDNPLKDDKQQEQSQDVKEILIENTMECEDQQEQRQDIDVSTSVRVSKDLLVPPENSLKEKDNEVREHYSADDSADNRQLHEREGSSSLYSKELFKCDYCKKPFRHKSKLIQHLRVHTGEKPFECSVCEKGFAAKGQLTIHFRKHTGEKPYECSYCKRKFSVKACFQNHFKIHSGEKPFECSYCQKRFALKQYLNNHVRTHTGENPYGCLYCKKKFRLRSGLCTHLRTHTGEKPFECSYCKKKFVQKIQLKTHYKIHAGNQNS